jgi:hypothetical protein
MVSIEPPIYVKPLGESTNVIVFGKPPELVFNDLAAGVARFGGPWRKPNYMSAYVRAARILVDNGIATNTLDDIALPAFSTQRHAVELLLKRFLSWMYRISEFRGQLRESDFKPSTKAQNHFRRSHNHSSLLRDISEAGGQLGFSDVPSGLKALVEKIHSFELTETWARYATNVNETIDHTKHECALPLVELQHSLEQVVAETTYSLGAQSYENDLYDEWLRAARLLGQAG